MGVAKILSSFVYESSYEDLPQNVVAVTKERTLDFIGTAFDSYWRYPMTSIIELLHKLGGKEEATVIGEGSKLPCSFAAMVNSAYNISDGSRFTGAHPACVIVPAALAASEAMCSARSVSGKELILAIALGYEIMLKIGRSMYPSSHNRGFSPTTIHGPIGAAAAVSKILGLDKERIMHAISIASLMGHGLQAADRAPYPTFSVQTGRASEGGVLSALFAQAGLKGSDDILEEGFFPAFSDEYHLSLIENRLGKEYEIASTYIKIHGGCRHMHGPVDAALSLRKRHNIQWQDIEQITVRIYSTALAVCNIENPKNGRQAEYTIQFGVPVALIYGDASPDRFADSVLRDDRVQQLMQKIKVELDPELDQEYPQKRITIVEITTKDSNTFSCRLDCAKGEPEDPLSPSKIEEKFNYMASKAINDTARAEIINFINKLETMNDIDGFFPLLKATCMPNG